MPDPLTRAFGRDKREESGVSNDQNDMMGLQNETER